MLTLDGGKTIGGISPVHRYLPNVISSIGEDRFGCELINLLNSTYGAEHFSLFRFSERSPLEVIAISRDGSDTAHRQFQLYVTRSFWRTDPCIAEAVRTLRTAALSMQRIDVSAMPQGEVRARLYDRTHVGERILLCGATRDGGIGLSILRPQERGALADHELLDLQAWSATLMSIVSKHTAIIESRRNFSGALRSLDEIEGTLGNATIKLPKREAQVCARILNGIPTAGIAFDLGISEETAMTYRKRAYQRLSIGSQRELLLWYIDQWSSGRCGSGHAPYE